MVAKKKIGSRKKSNIKRVVKTPKASAPRMAKKTKAKRTAKK
jgi:hypothetical protein